MKSFYGGQKYILTVQEYEAQVMDWSLMPDTGLEHPSHYVAMSYTITPELLDGTLDIAAATKATGRGRHPLRPGNPLLPHAPWWWESSAVQMATAVIYDQQRQGKFHAACSPLNFEPVDRVEWRIVFHEKQVDDTTVDLLS